MDGLDWSKFQQQQELEEKLMIVPSFYHYRDNYIPVQQLHKIDNSAPNLYPEWRSRSGGGAGGNCLEASINAAGPLINSPFHYTNPPHGTILDPQRTFESMDRLLSVEDDGISLTSLWNNNNANIHFQSVSGNTVPNQSSKRKRADEQKNHHFQQKKAADINFQGASSSAIAHMKEIIYQAAAFRPVDFGEEETERRPRRKNVRISSEPQTVAARERRERISERIRALQRLVPGGSKMDTASMLDEAANYLKFLRTQVKALEALGDPTAGNIDFPGNYAFAYSPLGVQQPQFSIQGQNPVRKIN